MRKLLILAAVAAVSAACHNRNQGEVGAAPARGDTTAVAKDSTTATLQGLSSRISEMNTSLSAQQSRLQKRFTAMETALAKINSQGGSLMSSLGQMSSSSSSTR